MNRYDHSINIQLHINLEFLKSIHINLYNIKIN